MPASFTEGPLHGVDMVVLALVEPLERTDKFLGGTMEVVPLIGGSGQSLDIFQINEMVRRAAGALGVFRAPLARTSARR